jgi:kynurenine formamidase
MRLASAGLAIALVSPAALAGCTSPPDSVQPSRVVDLGHALDAADPTWSGTPGYSRAAVTTFLKDGYASGRIDVLEHFGTHVDAPSHFAESGATTDAIAPDRLVRPGVCINVQTRVAGDEDYRITAADITAFETANGRIPEGGVVLIATGWDARWPDAARYMNVRGDVKHFPGLSVEAAALLARDRRVAGIGIDTPSIDYGPSSAFEAHRITQAEGVYHIENAANLTTLPAAGFTVVVAPVKIKGGSGGPTRVFALFR